MDVIRPRLRRMNMSNYGTLIPSSAILSSIYVYNCFVVACCHVWVCLYAFHNSVAWPLKERQYQDLHIYSQIPGYVELLAGFPSRFVINPIFQCWSRIVSWLQSGGLTNSESLQGNLASILLSSKLDKTTRDLRLILAHVQQYPCGNFGYGSCVSHS